MFDDRNDESVNTVAHFTWSLFVFCRSLILDLENTVRENEGESEFDQGMKEIFDYGNIMAAAGQNQDIQKRLYPYRGSAFNYLRRRLSRQ